MNKYLIGGLICMSLGILLSFTTYTTHIKQTKQSNATSINLAIRQVADQLLKINGDNKSTIPSVDDSTPNLYSIRITDSISYDSLPKILDKALLNFDIKDNYEVYINNCDSDQILLGYNQESFLRGETPCSGRERMSECNIINVAFIKDTSKYKLPPIAIIVFLLGILGLILSRRKQNSDSIKETPLEEPAPVDDSIIILGKSNFDPKLMTITYNNQIKSLTFRENKLLEYFANHKNEILKRDDIQNSVWNEEGVIVGRSLDVFISRLRKIIRPDETLSIKNIHGVGYKLEIQ